MKIPGLTMPVCIILCVFVAGCSDEEPPSAGLGKNKVVRSIVKPAAETPKSQQPAEGQDAEPERKPDLEGKAGVMAPKPEVSEPHEEPVKEEQAGPGYYAVKAGDSLSSIAARGDVCGDPLKWVILFRLNRDALGDFPMEKGLPQRVLPTGTKLKIPGPEEMKANMDRRSGRDWIVNILSATDEEEIAPAAIALAREGYPVYLARANLKGKVWVRLRLGFFKNREEADAAGKIIQRRLNLSDTWTSKAGKSEIEEFGGFWDQEK